MGYRNSRSKVLLSLALLVLGGACSGDVVRTTQFIQEVRVEGAAGIVVADVGDQHGCLIRSDGKIFCWGRNGNGQLGDGSTTDQPSLESATEMGGGVAFPTAVSAGGDHSCAVDVNGTVWCWGQGTNGELGNGATSDQTSPGAFILPTGLKARGVSAGFLSTCAVVTNGRIYCSGSNSSGQLGDTTTTNRSTPVAVKLDASTFLADSVQVGVGDFHACSLSGTGRVRCWGSAVANGTSSARSTPSSELSFGSDPSSNPNLVRAISVNGSFACALIADGAVRCWGQNESGQLGDGTTTASATPVQVSGLSNVVSISTGVFHACAILADGNTRCWGLNSTGQLGDGSTTNRSTPQAISVGSEAISTLTGLNFTFYLSHGGVSSSGADNAGQLGNGSSSTTLTSPSNVWQSLRGSVISTFQRGRILDVGSNHACAIVATGSFVQAAGTAADAGGLTSQSTTTGIACWGRNDQGQLGQGNTTDQSRPRFVSSLSTAPVAVATGASHSCALLANGRVWCWGLNDRNQLGDASGLGSSSTTPVQVSVTNVVAITAGDAHTCALLANGQVRCWGDAGDNRLGNYVAGTYPITGTYSAPQTVVCGECPTSPPALTNIAAISAGGQHTCAVSLTGEVYCWGKNDNGQCGQLHDDGVSFVARVLGGHRVVANTGTASLSSIITVSAGAEHTCAMAWTGSATGNAAWCWGRNQSTQVAASGGPFMRPQSVVTRLTGGEGDALQGVAAGGDTTCVLQSSNTGVGKIRCLGGNGTREAGSNASGSTASFQTIQALSGTTPFDVVDHAARVVPGANFSCSFGWDGLVACWGSNTFGSLGRGTTGSATEFLQQLADL